jgi:hypothetical protein
MDVAYLFLLVLGGCIVALLLTADLKLFLSRLFFHHRAKHSRIGVVVASLLSLAVWVVLGLLLL